MNKDLCRGSGVFLNISSLTGDFGIGDFSKEAEYFIDEIFDMGFRYWQVLPLTPIGMGNSPYSSFSAYAGNYLYVDPYRLTKGLISADEIQSFRYSGQPYNVDFEYAKWVKKEILQLAYLRLTADDKKNISNFQNENRNWVNDYAIFMALKEKFGQKPWFEWDKEFKFKESLAIEKLKKENFDKIEFYVYEQYEFNRQWERVKKYANEKGIQIFGDMPFYVAHDSVECWCSPEMFLLDDSLTPKVVAGVPPDYFSEEGQLWGNPIYNWQNMENKEYKWFIDRLSHDLKRYDILRIDHFRGFYEFYAVEYGAKNAKVGKWCKGADIKMWEKLKDVVESPKIIAEDLGTIDNGVLEYLEKVNFPGMRVFHFGFDGKSNNTHLPHTYPINCVAYSGTHDNNTTLGWLYDLNTETRDKVLEYIDFSAPHWGRGGYDCDSNKAIIRTLMASSANLVILPMQDLCGYGSDARLNKPGIAEGNWAFRITYGTYNDINRDFFRQLNRIYGRGCATEI